MFISIILRAFLPFAAPILLLIAALLLGRNRLSFLKVIPVWAFVLVIALLIVLWLLLALLRWRAERKNAEALEAGLDLDAAPGADVRPDLRERFIENQLNIKKAIATLKQSPQGKKALYTIPWYVIIGPPAIGKTTAIKNSGLNFPGMTTAMRLRGQGGTRNCDWWFSTDAIILDTAGRYAQSADRTETEQEWFSFLDLLKQHRRKAPLNGLILGYSMETMVENQETKIINDARELRQRIDEIMARLGWSFPVYVLFTKGDLVSGFADFFSTLPPIERFQVWGATFPLKSGEERAPGDQLLVEYDVMMERLRALRTQRIVETSREELWGRVFMFPEEMAALRGKLHLFVETLFEPNPFHHDQPLCRGTFFSSGRQMGRPLEIVVGNIQKILGAAATGLESEEQEETEDAYFVRDLFTKVFRHDKDLARSTRARGLKANRAKWMVSVGVGAAALLLSGFIITSYGRLQSRMHQTVDAVEQISTIGSRPISAADLASFRRLRDRVEGSWKAGPLFVANTVKDRAGALYQDALRNRVLAPTEEEIRSRLQTPSALTGDEARLALRSELLLLHPEWNGQIGGPRELAEGLLAFGLPADPEVRQHVELFARDFLERGVPLVDPEARRNAVLSGARRLVASHSPEAYYDRIVAGASRKQKDLTLADLAGDQDILKSDRVVRAAYTKAGWSEVVSQEIEDVAGIVKSDNRLIELAGGSAGSDIPERDEILRRYLADYPREWGELFASVRLPGYSSCEGAKDDYSTLKGPSSPLMRLIRGAAEEARFGHFGSSLTGNELEPIEKAMSPVLDLVDPPKEGAGLSLDSYGEKLLEVQGQISLCAKDPAKSTGDFNEVEEPIKDFAAMHSGSPVTPGLRNMLLLPIQKAERLIETGIVVKTKDEVAKAWNEGVMQSYDDGLKGHYPFARDSRELAIPNELASFFGSSGPLTDFEKTLQKQDLSPGPETGRALRKAHDVRSSLGVDQGMLRAAFRLTVSPPRSSGTPTGDASLRQIDLIEFVVNDQHLEVRSSTQSKAMTWTSADQNPVSYISVRQMSGNRELGRIDGGSTFWSWFQLVDKAEKIEREADGTRRVTWRFPDLDVDVSAEIKMNLPPACPFDPNGEFRTFRLPDGYEQ